MSREVPLGGNEYRKRSNMYTAPIQEALQMIRARISTAAIVDSLAQHVLCSVRRLFGAYGPRTKNIHTYIHTHELCYHPQPLFRHHPSFARQNKKSSTKTHQLHLHESQPKWIATQKKLPLLIIKMIGCDDSDLIRLCGVRDLCVLCYGNVVSLITKFLTALCLVFWSLSLTTT
jgi:hypothetical protein